jgi:TfoX/Sxy family transcriptional regulator of competence genes
MAYNEKLANRTREIISLTHKRVVEKKMFGGLCFMVNDKMCIVVEKDRLMLRIDPAKYDELLAMDGCAPMDFTGKVMRGYIFVSENVLTIQKKLAYWVKLALEYNEIAKPSKKRTSSKEAKTKLQRKK